MNTFNQKITQLLVTGSLLLASSAVLASHPIDIEANSTGNTKFSNIKAEVSSNAEPTTDTISISGKMKRASRSHVNLPGQIRIELYDKSGEIFKTVNVTQKRHRHHVNKAYPFSSTIPLESHDVSKIRVVEN